MTSLLPAGYLQTSGASIVDENGNSVRLAGVNWYGFDCNGLVAGGLDRQPLDALCEQIAGLGFNSVRLPFSVQLVRQNPPVTRSLDRNPALQGRPALEIMDAVIEGLGRSGLKVILDSHRLEAGWSTQRNGLWYTEAYTEADWLRSWQTLTARYAGTDTVIGCDLHNEPGAPPLDAAAWPRNGGACWGYNPPENATRYPNDWPSAAERAGDEILAINPNLLIIVEGVRYDPAGPVSNGNLYWPGGNLNGVARAAGPRRADRPVRLSVSNRLVYSVHDYGPDMYSGLPWCSLGSTASTPYASFAVWDETWGYIAQQGIAPVWLGEFGTVNGHKPGVRASKQEYTDPNPTNAQGTWFSYLIEYIRSRAIHWCYWCLNGTQSEAPGRNADRPDWYGVLDPSWSKPASEPLLEKLCSIQ